MLKFLKCNLHGCDKEFILFEPIIGILLSSSSIAVLDCKPSRKFLYPNVTTYHNAW